MMKNQLSRIVCRHDVGERNKARKEFYVWRSITWKRMFCLMNFLHQKQTIRYWVSWFRVPQAFFHSWIFHDTKRGSFWASFIAFYLFYTINDEYKSASRNSYWFWLKCDSSRLSFFIFVLMKADFSPQKENKIGFGYWIVIDEHKERKEKNLIFGKIEKRISVLQWHWSDEEALNGLI